LLPLDPAGRARVRALAQTVACEIHPLNNLRVLRYLTQELKIDEAAKIKWIQHWIALGFAAFEAQLANSASTGAFCHGNTPTLADCCLIPQLYNARRFDTPLDAYPTLLRIEAACLALAAFQDARPETQPDAV
jgi:maleylacetoacetate isomerase